MRRRLLNLLTALSLLLCVATLAWWARSFLPADLHVGAVDGRLVLLFCDPSLTHNWEANQGHVSAEEKWGSVRAGRYIEPPQYAQKVDPNGVLVDVAVNGPPRVAGLLGFAYATDAPAQDYVLVTVPLLLPAVLLAVPPVLALVGRRRRRRRSRAGSCPSCGYDLTANVSGVCPECGVRSKAEGTAG